MVSSNLKIVKVTEVITRRLKINAQGVYKPFLINGESPEMDNAQQPNIIDK